MNSGFRHIKYFFLILGMFVSVQKTYAQSNFIIAPTLGNNSEAIGGFQEIETGYFFLVSSSNWTTLPTNYELNLVHLTKYGLIKDVFNLYSTNTKKIRTRPSSLKKLPNGNYLVFGSFDELSSGLQKSFLLEINEFGEKFNYTESTLQVDRQSNFDAIIDSFGIKILCIDTVKYDCNIRIDEYDFMFNKLSESILVRNNAQVESFFIPMRGGGYAIAGGYARTLRIDSYIMGVNEDLTERWYKTIISSSTEALMEPAGIAELVNGDLLYCSGLQKNGNYISKYARRINPLNGETIWEKQYYNGFSHSSFSPNVVVKGENEIYLPGYSDVPEVDNTSRPFFRYPTLTKINEVGDIIWERLYYTEKYRRGYPYYMQPTSDGGFIITGTALASLEHSQTALIIKTDSLGCIVPGCDSLGMVSSIVEINNPQGTFTYGPNPVIEDLSINYSLFHQSADYSLQLIDNRGKLIRKLPLAAYTSEGQVIWGMTELPAGTYFLSLIYRDRVQTTAKILKL